jgi:hypothetical protein
MVKLSTRDPSLNT